MSKMVISLGACVVAALFAVMQPALGADFTACGITSTVAFQTWTKSLETNFPVIYPSNEAELRDIVKEVAKVPGCKIRVAGTKVAIDGLIALKQDPLVVVVSLADMQTHENWDNVLDAKKGKVRMGAGKTILDLAALVRPQGFIPVSRSFGRYFSLGGFYLNPSTHGGTLGSDRVSKHVTAVRVLTSDGKYSVIKGNDIKHWRGSMGLLGIVVALEIKLTKDLGLVQVASQVSLPGPHWNIRNITNFIRSAIQPADSAHFFYNVYDDTLLALTTINGADPTFDKAATAGVYTQLKQQYADLAKSGFPVLNVNDVLAQLPPGLTPLQIAGGVALNALQTISGGWQLANTMARDGYLHDLTPSLSVNLLEVQIKCQSNCIDDGITFRALEGLRSIVQAAIGLNIWYPTLPVNFRYFVVKKTPAMTLDPHSPGTYLAIELTNAKGVFPNDKHGSVFRRVERFLKALVNKSYPHLGKEYGFDMAKDRCDEEPGAFQDDVLSHTLYSAKAKNDFTKAMNKYDKKKLFRAGAVLHLLGLSEDKFDTRVPLGGNCALNRDCINGCCCNYLPTCFAQQLLNKCVPCDSPLL